MACACSKRKQEVNYVWTSADGTETMTYTSLLQAKAKMHRKGGSYVAVPKT
jgi:hypothetical protein